MRVKISVIVPVFNVEPFISETLDSLVNQSFSDFEVIIIDDGSTDQTQTIVKDYCEHHANFRCIVQENSGAAAAKNRGIKEAKGDYLAFLDGDDIFAPNALEKLFYYANKNQAELVIGRTQVFNLFRSKYQKATVRLSNKDNIDPFDLDLVWSFSQSNKLFSREKILELNLRFPDKKYAEDGIFVLNFAHHCDKIVGCPHDILFYRKRTFKEECSATQTVSREMIEDYLSSYEQVYELSRKNFRDKYGKEDNLRKEPVLNTHYHAYLEKIRFKEVTLLIDQFYRLFWRMVDADLKYLKGAILSLKSELFASSWERLVNEHPDMDINNLIDSAQKMGENPLVTIILDSKNASKNQISWMIKSFYNQNLPAFEILVSPPTQKKIGSEILKYENIHLLVHEDAAFKNIALQYSRGRYVLFIDEFTILGPESLQTLFQNIHASNMDMITAPISRLHHDRFSNYPLQELVYSHRQALNPSRKSKFNYLDLYLNNKLLKKEFLVESGFEFSKDPAADVLKLYETAKFMKIRSKHIFIDKKEKKMVKSLKSLDKRILLKTSAILFTSHSFYLGLRIRRFLQKYVLNKISPKFKKEVAVEEVFEYPENDSSS